MKPWVPSLLLAAAVGASLVWARRTLAAHQTLTATLAVAELQTRQEEERLGRPPETVRQERETPARADPVQSHRTAGLPPSPWDAALLRDPSYENLWIGSARFRIHGRYAAFIREAGLSAETGNKLMQLLLDRAATEVDINAAGDAKGLAHDDPDLERMRDDAEKQLSAGEAALLSPAQLRELADYGRTLQAQQAVQIFAGRSVVAGMPLTLQQTDELTVWLANASSSYQQGGNATFDTVDWSQALAEAASIITPQQLRLLRTLVEVQTSAGQLNRYLETKLAPSQAAH